MEAVSWVTRPDSWIPLWALPWDGCKNYYCTLEISTLIHYSYLFKYLLSTSNQLTSLALVLQYWVSRDKVNPGVFIAVFYVTIIFINYFGVRVFGETEFWLSALKLCVLIGILILSLILVSGGGPKHDAIGFR